MIYFCFSTIFSEHLGFDIENIQAYNAKTPSQGEACLTLKTLTLPMNCSITLVKYGIFLDLFVDFSYILYFCTQK